MSTVTGKPTKPSKPAGKALKPTTNPSNTTHESQVKVKIRDIVTVNLFFDGTRNNFYNFRDRRNFSRETLYQPKKYESYLNNYSNVANLYRFINQKNVSDSTLNIYIEGIGTENAVLNQNNQLVSSGKADSKQGFAYGSGSTGVKTRALEACEKIVEMAKAKKIRANHLRINLFGFSRGAATARHFMHLIKTKPGSLSGWNLKAHQIRFGFVGLFDTVSSFHDFDWKSVAKRGGGVANPNFNDDVGELGLDFRALDANDKKITKIIHIIAMDEYRNYFSVTNINSAIVGKYGIEILLNGAHSDIGGGYHNNTSDFYEIDGNNTKLRQWFIDKGYYKEDQIIPIERKVLSNYFRLSRSGIKHDIYKITLQIMLKFAQSPKYAGLTFNNMGDNIKPDTFITDLMGKFPQQVFDFAEEKGNWGKYQNLQLQEGSNNLKTLRNKYVHWSAKYIKWGSDNADGESAVDEIGYEVRLENGVPKREPIPG